MEQQMSHLESKSGLKKDLFQILLSSSIEVMSVQFFPSQSALPNSGKFYSYILLNAKTLPHKKINL
jgi:hypothetical protein